MAIRPPIWVDLIKLELLIRLSRLYNWIAGWGWRDYGD